MHTEYDKDKRAGEKVVAKEVAKIHKHQVRKP